MWCIPKVDAEFVARMEDVLDALRRGAGRATARRVLRRDAPTAHRRVPRAGRRRAREARARRLRVRAQRHRERLHVCRRAPALAPREGDRPAHVRRLRRVHARPRRQALPEAERIRVVMDNLSTHTPAALYETLRARRGSPHPAPARIPLHAQARELAEHGRDRDRRHGRPMPRPPHPQDEQPRLRGRRLGATAKQRKGQHQVALHRGARPREARPSLSHLRRPTGRPGRA